MPSSTITKILLLTLPLLSSFTAAQNTTEGPRTSWSSAGLSDYAAILQTINLDALSADTQDTSLLSQVFTEDAVASYFATDPDVVGLANLTAFAAASLAGLTSQHLIGTPLVEIDCGAANATTFAQATIWADPVNHPQNVVYLYGFYNDRLVKTDQGWRISHRLYRFMGPPVGNTTIIGR